MVQKCQSVMSWLKYIGFTYTVNIRESSMNEGFKPNAVFIKRSL